MEGPFFPGLKSNPHWKRQSHGSVDGGEVAKYLISELPENLLSGIPRESVGLWKLLKFRTGCSLPYRRPVQEKVLILQDPRARKSYAKSCILKKVHPEGAQD